jgi:hypothetical protein
MSFLGGTRTGRTVTPRNILKRSGDDFYLPGPLVLDAGNATYRRSVDGGNTGYTNEIRAGAIMAQITASKKWVPCKLTTVTGGGSGSGSGAGSAVIPVVNAAFFVVGETISVQPKETGKTPARVTRVISAVDYANNLITVAGAALQYNTGDEVYVVTFSDGTTSAAGCEIPRAILAQTVWTNNLEDAIDAAAGTLYDKAIQLLDRGYVDNNYILGDYAACRTTAVQYLTAILWDDRQQGQ